MPSLVRSFSNHIYHNDLVEPNDLILLAISGGIDSLVMAKLFSDYSKKSNLNVEVSAAYVNIEQVSIGSQNISQLKTIINNFGLELTIIPASIEQQNSYNCYICSKERRKALFTYYDKNHFDAIAFGHHKDDLIETGFMNFINHGNLETLKSVDYMFNNVIKVIRPLLSASKKNIRYFANSNNIEAINSAGCQFGSDSKRSEIRNYLQIISRDNPQFKKNLYNAILEYNNRDY